MTEPENRDYTTVSHWQDGRQHRYTAEWRRWDKLADSYQVWRCQTTTTRLQAETLAQRWAEEYRLEYRP